MVLAASGNGTVARAALEEICRIYWFPLYAFARQSGCSPEDAEDETQEFLARVASREILSTATATRGHLRTFLLAAFRRDLVDSHRRATRQKRGGNAEHLSIDSVQAEGRLSALTAAATPEGSFDRLWAMTCLDTAIATLETEYTQRGRQALFQTLRAFLDPESDVDYQSAAQKTGLDPSALRQAVMRLRQRFRALLRQIISDTLENPTDALIEEELASLRAALSK
jgi:RNA polymerase sigma-70 factor (ECF subfamily)